MAWDDILSGLVKTGERALGNLADRATLGRDAARDIRLAEERDFYAGLNGSGPSDRQGALKDAKAGNPYFRDPFGGALSGGGWQSYALIAVGVLVVVLLIKKL